MAFNLFKRRHSRAVKEKAAAFRTELSGIALTVAGRFSRGNVAIQHRHVLMPERLERERERLRRELEPTS